MAKDNTMQTQTKTSLKQSEHLAQTDKIDVS